MQELLDQLLDYVRGAWRFRWYMHLVAWPLCIAGWIIVHQLPNQYEASARVYVDTQSVLRPLLRGLAVQGNVGQEVQLMTRTLLSRPNLEKIARMTDMDLTVTTPEDMEELLDRLKHTIKLTGRGRENLYSLTYTDNDPRQAKQVVQSLLTLFVETSLGDSRKDSRSAQSFLDTQIKEYEARLFAAEERLKEFKRENIGLMPTDGGGEYFTRLQAAMSRLSNAELELSEAVNRRNELRRQLRGEEPTFGMVAPPKAQVINSALDARIQSLQTRLDDLLLQFTDKHPDVSSLQRTIKTLEEQKAKEIAQLEKSAPQRSNNLDTNPVYQQLRISLGEVDANVVGLGVRVKQFQAEVDKLKQAVDVIPKIEADFKRLNRDYDVNKKNYDTLVERRETAKMSEDASKSGDNVKFRVIDPPFVPSEPSSPNRPLLTSAVLIGGWLAGILFAFFMSQIKPTFDGVRPVTRELGLPVLGSVSRVWTGKARLKRRMEVITFGIGGLLLVSVYGAYMTYQLLFGGAA